MQPHDDARPQSRQYCKRESPLRLRIREMLNLQNELDSEINATFVCKDAEGQNTAVQPVDQHNEQYDLVDDSTEQSVVDIDAASMFQHLNMGVISQKSKMSCRIKLPRRVTMWQHLARQMLRQHCHPPPEVGRFRGRSLCLTRLPRVTWPTTTAW